MEQSQLAKIIAVLKVSYPYYFKDLDKSDVLGMISIYKQQFKEFHISSLANSINLLIKKCKFMPTIAEIYEECEKQQTNLYRCILENNSNIQESRKKYLLDMVDWYCVSAHIMPLELKNEILGYYDYLLKNNGLEAIGTSL